MSGGATAFLCTRGHMLPFLFTFIIYRSSSHLQSPRRKAAVIPALPGAYAPRTGGAYDSHHRTAGIAGRTRRRGCGVAARGARAAVGEAAHVRQRKKRETAVATMAYNSISADIPTPEGLDSIFPALARERVEAVIVLRDAMFYAERRRIAALAVARRLPVIYAFREHVDDGGLISYGINLPENFRRSADYVVKILKGANPGDLPVEFPTRLELIINLKAAS